jgi:hypothetical protein
MDSDQKFFLGLDKPPARITSQEAAWLLGFNDHEIPILTAVGLLHPLGRPAPNAPKYYSASEIDLLRSDRKFLEKAAIAIQHHWRRKRQTLKKRNDASLDQASDEKIATLLHEHSSPLLKRKKAM